MPLGVEYCLGEVDFLRREINRCYSINPTDTLSCIELSRVVLRVLGKRISYNTLRRLFGVVSYSGRPSSYTLNTLAALIGHSSWSSFTEGMQQRDNERFLIKNHILTQYGNYSNAWIVDFITRLDRIRWQDSYQLKSLVHAAVVNRNQELLMLLTQLPVSLDDSLSMQRLYMSFESVIWEASKSGPDYWKWIGEVLLKRPVFRTVILEYYVNEDALDGYYGYWLNLPYEDTSQEFLLFRSLLNGQKCFEIGKGEAALRPLIQQFIQNGHWKDYHPIIRGRIVAWAAIFNLIHHEFVQEICEQFDDWYGKAAFTTFFYRLYWSFGSKSIFHGWNWRGELPHTGMFNTFEFSQWNNYLLIQCVLAKLQNDRILCSELLQLVDPYLFALDYFHWLRAQYNECLEFVSEHKK